MARVEPTQISRFLANPKITQKYLFQRQFANAFKVRRFGLGYTAIVNGKKLCKEKDGSNTRKFSTKSSEFSHVKNNEENTDNNVRVNVRKYATNLAVEKEEKSLHISDIPAPKGIPFLGTTFSLILAGSSPQLHWYIDRRHKELGPIFREKIGPVDCIFLSDPGGMRSVFAQEGKYPLHILPSAWLTYNKIHGITRGLFFMNGEEWLRFRRIMNNCLLKGDTTWLEDSCRPAVENLLKKLEKSAETGETFKNLESNLYRWSLDVILSTLLGPEHFQKNEHLLAEHLEGLASSIRLIFETSSKLELISPEFAATLKIPRWNKFESTVTKALNTTKKLITLLCDQKFIDCDGLLAKIRPHMSQEDLTRIVVDLILAAGDTTAYSMEWAMYLLGKNAHIQDRLRKELKEDSIKGEKQMSNVFAKSIIKETLRLYPVAPFLTRILPQPSKIMGYECPANTVVILSIFSTGRDEKFFSHPLEFSPDRWIKREQRSSIVQNSNLPFAIGSRSCVGRKLAEIQMQLTLENIVKNFKFSVENKQEVNVIMKMVAVPSCPIEFKFVKI